jgi:hypothetical protein
MTRGEQQAVPWCQQQLQAFTSGCMAQLSVAEQQANGCAGTQIPAVAPAAITHVCMHARSHHPLQQFIPVQQPQHLLTTMRTPTKKPAFINNNINDCPPLAA